MAAPAASTPWPTRFSVAPDRDVLTATYDDGSAHRLSAELLRVMTPSAERKGHGARLVVGGKAAVRITRMEPVGRYAVRIVFDDGHASGLYTFDGLHDLGRDADAVWADYLAELATVGLDRERPGTAPAPDPSPV